MFTMSLGGSSVKLETGKQIDTKTRQKPLEFSDKFIKFVTFDKNRITVTIDSFKKDCPEFNGGDVSFPFYKTLLENNMYLCLQVRCNRSAICYDVRPGQPEYTDAYRLQNSRWEYSGSSCGTAWKTILIQQMVPEKSVYDFGIQYIKDAIFNASTHFRWINHKKNMWNHFYTNGAQNSFNGDYPPFIKIRIAICFNQAYLSKYISDYAIPFDDTIHDQTYLEKIRPEILSNGFCFGLFRFRTLNRTQEKYITI